MYVPDRRVSRALKAIRHARLSLPHQLTPDSWWL
jgi:hypothetical protein